MECSTNQQISAAEAVHGIQTTVDESLVSSNHPCTSALSPDTATADPSQCCLLSLPNYGNLQKKLHVRLKQSNKSIQHANGQVFLNKNQNLVV